MKPECGQDDAASGQPGKIRAVSGGTQAMSSGLRQGGTGRRPGDQKPSAAGFKGYDLR